MCAHACNSLPPTHVRGDLAALQAGPFLYPEMVGNSGRLRRPRGAESPRPSGPRSALPAGHPAFPYPSLLAFSSPAFLECLPLTLGRCSLTRSGCHSQGAALGPPRGPGLGAAGWRRRGTQGPGATGSRDRRSPPNPVPRLAPISARVTAARCRTALGHGGLFDTRLAVAEWRSGFLGPGGERCKALMSI